ncbi:MAG: tetratricopeptide repeat protein [bacterium]|nr:tetratricopeptide repeat protein [bacterium]
MIIHSKTKSCLTGLWLLLLSGCIPDQSIGLQEIKDTGGSVEQECLEKGLACYKEGNLDSAIFLFAECLKINPNNQEARKLFEEGLKMKDGKEKGVEKVPLESEEKAQEIKSQQAAIQKIPVKQGTQTPSVSTASTTKKVDTAKLEPLFTKQKGSVEKIKKELSAHRKEELKEPELPKSKPEIKSQKIIDYQQAKDFNFAKDIYSKGLFDAAAGEFKTFLDKYPNTILKEKILYLLANAFIKAKKYPEAIDTAKKLIDINGEFENDGIFLLAQAYDESGSLKQAQAEYLKAAMGKRPADVKGAAQHVQKFLDETAPYPTALDELTIKARLSAGNAYKKDGEYDQSLFEYHRVINDHPESASTAEAYFRIGEIYQKASRIRDFQKAYDAYQKIVKQYPHSSWAKKAKKQADYLWENYLK